MNVLTPYIRQTDGSSQTSRQTLDSVQLELDAMQMIAQALASIPEDRVRARVMAWAREVFSIGGTASTQTERRAASLETAGTMLEALRALESPVPLETGHAVRGAAESFYSEEHADTASVLLVDAAPASETPSDSQADPASEAESAPEPPPASDHAEPLTTSEIEALSIKDVETLFDDTRPPQGRFPPGRFRRRHLRPRLVLRFRLWK